MKSFIPQFMYGPGGAGGGGQSGTVVFADDQKWPFHELMVADESAAASDYTGTITTGFMDIIDTALQAGGNPYTGETAYDPTFELQHAQSEVDDLDTYVDAIDYDADWESMIDTTVGKLSDVGLTSADDIGETVQKAIATSLIQTLSVIGQAISTAKNDADSAFDDSIANVSAHVSTEHTALKAASITAVDADSDAAHTKERANTVSIVNEAISDMVGQAGSIVDIAVQKAASSLDSTVLTGARTAFENRKLGAHLRSISRASAGMADVNAVNSSAFIIGLAILEDEHAKELDNFDKEMIMNNYNQVLSSYVNTVSKLTTDFLNTYLQKVSSYLTMLNGDASLYSSLLDSFNKTQVSLLSDFVNRYGTNHADMFARYLSGQLGIDMQFSDLKNRFVLAGTDQVRQLQGTEIQAQLQKASMQVDLDRMKLVAYSEQYVQDLQIDIGDARWDLEVMQYPANLMASLQGGVVTTPTSLTKGQSVLGGAFAGASIGAQIPGAGGIGALTGALIGAGMGALAR